MDTEVLISATLARVYQTTRRHTQKVLMLTVTDRFVNLRHHTSLMCYYMIWPYLKYCHSLRG